MKIKKILKYNFKKYNDLADGEGHSFRGDHWQSEINSDFVWVLILPVLTTCENFVIRCIFENFEFFLFGL